MCGICGNVALSSLTSPDAAHLRVKAMLRSLSHRGPDATRQVDTDLAVLGATRLAIRGLTDQLNQPMVDAESGVIAVCNGEIDNHRELGRWLAERGRSGTTGNRRRGDSRAVSRAWRRIREAASRGLCNCGLGLTLTGASPWCATAPGNAPCFILGTDNEIIFATEIAALVGHGRLHVNLDQEALRKYLQFGIFPSPDTPFSEIRKVAPGELIQFDKTGMCRKSYWRWQIAETAKQHPSLDGFDQTFRAAIGRQTDVDVDFGVFLSGGIDSSLVSAVVRSLHPKRPLKAYTLRFEEDSFDEGRFAAAVAKQLQMELVAVLVKPDDVRDGLKSLIRMVGEPLADPAWIPTSLLAQRAAQETKMALVGEGADELFGGYPTYIGGGDCGTLRTIAELAQVRHPPRGGSASTQREEGDDFLLAQAFRGGRELEWHDATPALDFQHHACTVAATRRGTDRLRKQ